MRSVITIVVLVGLCAVSSPVKAQDPSPRIPTFVVDLHANVLSFPDSALLAQSRGLTQSELPGFGIGGDVAAHVYPFKWRAMTLGLGGQLNVSRARRTPVADPGTTLRPVTERFTAFAPQLSFNFGTGNGWSYVSGGIATSKWSLVADGTPARPSDKEGLKTINYGGGARWFAKPHVAFSFDVRFYAINPGTASGSLPGSPRTTLRVIGAGISLK
jgi:hypothetical protein